MSPEVHAIERIVFNALPHPRLRKAKLPFTTVYRLICELQNAEAEVARLRARVTELEARDRCPCPECGLHDSERAA